MKHFSSLVAVFFLVGCSHAAQPVSSNLPDETTMMVAVNQTWAGLQELANECSQDAQNAFKSHNWSEAEGVSGECIYLEALATVDHQILLSFFGVPWKPEDATKMGCFLHNIMKAYQGITNLVVQYGYIPNAKVMMGVDSINWLRSIRTCG